MSKTFEDFNFNKQVLSAIADAGYETPTPIQVKAIPPILNGQDVLGIAQTGTGKTAAYVLPMIMKLKYGKLNLIFCLIFRCFVEKQSKVQIVWISGVNKRKRG